MIARKTEKRNTECSTLAVGSMNLPFIISTSALCKYSFFLTYA